MKDFEAQYSLLQRNMTAAVVTVSIAPLLIIFAFVFSQYRTSYVDRVHGHVAELVRKHQLNVDTFLIEKLRELRFISTSYDMQHLKDQESLRGILNALGASFDDIFVDLGVVGPSGKQVAYAGPFSLSGADYANADWYRQALVNEEYISDVFLGLRESPHFIIAVKTMQNGEPWILRATINFLSFSRLVESIKIGETGNAFILNRDGVFQTREPHGLEISPDDLLRAEPNILHRAGTANVSELENARGETFLVVTAPLKGGGWELVYTQKTSDAYSALIVTQRVAIAILILGSVCIVAMGRIVSRRMVDKIRRVHLENEQMNRQVVESGRLAAIGELAAGIAHEINNPVAIMIEEAGWMCDLLEAGEADKDDYAEFRLSLAQIRNQGDRCKDITHKLLRFARKTDSRLQLVDVNEFITEVVGLFEQSAGYANIRVEKTLGKDVPLVEASVSEMQQVVLNLVNNSLQAMEKTGGHLEIASSYQAGKVVIRVTDDGPGIPRAIQASIFDPFFTTKPVGKGTGLGLSICYGIVRAMGGDIAVESEVGMGASFLVKLPPAAEEGQRTGGASTPDRAPQREVKEV